MAKKSQSAAENEIVDPLASVDAFDPASILEPDGTSPAKSMASNSPLGPAVMFPEASGTNSLETILQEAMRCGMPYVTARWLGGMLTNWRTIRQRINELEIENANVHTYNRELGARIERQDRQILNLLKRNHKSVYPFDEAFIFRRGSFDWPGPFSWN